MASILIADDDPEICGFLRRVVRRTVQKVQVVTARDGREALEALLAGSFELAILELQMPNMTGLEVICAARRKGVETSIVLLTGWATGKLAQQVCRAGGQDLLEKPIILQDIVDTVHSFLPRAKISTLPEKKL